MLLQIIGIITTFPIHPSKTNAESIKFSYTSHSNSVTLPIRILKLIVMNLFYLQTRHI